MENTLLGLREEGVEKDARQLCQVMAVPRRLTGMSVTQVCTPVRNAMLTLPAGPVVKNPPATTGDTTLIPAAGRLYVRQSS